jgi:ubiquinone/menaquinone biosynthesis C-methylase UbiE
MEEFLNPEKVLEELDLRPDMVAAEFGCGAGGFAIPLARKLENGLVYAIDILDAPLSFLKSRANMEHIVNIKTVKSDLERPKGSLISPMSLDLVLIPNILFQAKEKGAIIEEANRVLKEKGILMIVDWLPEARRGPVNNRVSPEEIKKISQEKGFVFQKEFTAGSYHYGIIFGKP